MKFFRHTFCSRFIASVLSFSTLVWIVSPSLAAEPDSFNPEWERMADLVHADGNEGLVPAFEAAIRAEGKDTRDFLRYFIGYLRLHPPTGPVSLFDLDWSDTEIANRLYARINSFRSDAAVLPSWSSSATGFVGSSDIRHIFAASRSNSPSESRHMLVSELLLFGDHSASNQLSLLTNLFPQGP